MAKENKRLEDVKREFREAGVTVAGWARENGFDKTTVRNVLTGRLAGTYGKSHQIAVALGLKSGKVVSVKQFKSARGA